MFIPLSRYIQKDFELFQNGFRLLGNHFEKIQSDFQGVGNGFELFQNDFRPLENDFEKVQNDFQGVGSDFELFQNDFLKKNSDLFVYLKKSAYIASVN